MSQREKQISYIRRVFYLEVEIKMLNSLKETPLDFLIFHFPRKSMRKVESTVFNQSTGEFVHRSTEAAEIYQFFKGIAA